MFRSLATTVIVNGYIKTNLQRAKVLRGKVEKLITMGKKGTLASRRSAAKILRPVKTKEGVEALKYLFDELAKKYEKRMGGYTRIVKIPPRRGDNTKMAIVELVE